MKKSCLYEIDGANRGGKEHYDALMKKASRSNRPSEVRVVDPTPGRAESLARLFEGQGISATYVEEKAQPESDAAVRVIAMDDVKETLRTLENSNKQSLVECGLVVSANTFGTLGGTVLSLGTTLAPGDVEARKQAASVLAPIAELAPERKSSRNVSERILNSPQVVGARQGMHSNFAEKSVSFLERKPVRSDLCVIDGSTGMEFLMQAVEVPKGTLRRELKNIAINEVIPVATDGGSCRGVAFYDRSDPWLYFVFAQNSGGRWRAHRAIELPVQVPAPQRLQLTPLPQQKRAPLLRERLREATETISEMFVTD